MRHDFLYMTRALLLGAVLWLEPGCSTILMLDQAKEQAPKDRAPYYLAVPATVALDALLAPLYFLSSIARFGPS
jgi:uncharacterized protein YceK